MKKTEKKASGIPLSIVVLVLVLVVVGGVWLYNTSRPSPVGPANRSAQANGTQRQPQAPANAPLGAPVGVNMIGPASAAVTVEEFADYQCGACANVHPVMKELQGAYAGNRNFRFIYRHFPLSIPGHDKSYEASVATEAAGLQGKFWQMQDQLFRNQQAWTANPNYRDLWTGYAANAGMDVERFKNDMAGIATKQRVDLDMQRGRALNISSTPSVFVNGVLVPFQELNIASLRQVVDGELQKAAAAANNSPAGNSK